VKRTGSARAAAFVPATLVAAAFGVLLAGCGRQPAPPPAHRSPYTPATRTVTPIDVSRIELGTAANPDGTIARPTTSFGPHDTIVAAVTTQRPGRDIKLTARWIYGDDRVASETTRTISPAQVQVTDFQVSNGAGWPVGLYKLEIAVNGTRVAVTSFEVHR